MSSTFDEEDSQATIPRRVAGLEVAVRAIWSRLNRLEAKVVGAVLVAEVIVRAANHAIDKLFP